MPLFFVFTCYALNLFIISSFSISNKYITRNYSYYYCGRPQRVTEANATHSHVKSCRRASHVRRQLHLFGGTHKKAPPLRGCCCTPIQLTALTVQLNRFHINTSPLRIQRSPKLEPCFPSRSNTTVSIPARKRRRLIPRGGVTF